MSEMTSPPVDPNEDPNKDPKDAEALACPHCLKPPSVCVCDAIKPIDNRVEVLILQHPQEQDRILGTARLLALQLTRCTFKIGLSWPSLSKALGEEADPNQWAVMHLGAVHGEDLPDEGDVFVLDRKGHLLQGQERELAAIRGLIVFDGTWSQAKTLWWRNAWVLKTRRIVLNPKQPSLYGRLRKEPRREGLSTLEAVALALGRIERNPELEKGLRSTFARMLQRYRDGLKQGLAELMDGVSKPKASANRPKRHWGKTRRQSADSAP